MPDYKVRSASFRGVSFAVNSTSLEGGRRVVVHEYPQKDAPYVEDLGKKARSYPVEAFVIGADYQFQRDRLIDALEKAGPGKLVHPFYGSKDVQVVSFSVQESKDDGGMATFSIQFSETKAVIYPVTVLDIASQMQSFADAFDSVMSNNFITNFNADYIEKAVEVVGSAMDLTESALTPVHQLLGTAARFVRSVTKFKEEVGSIISAPGEFVARLQGIFTFPANPGLAGMDSMDGLHGSISSLYGAQTFLSSESSQVEQANNALIRDVILGKILSENSKAVVGGYVRLFSETSNTTEETGFTDLLNVPSAVDISVTDKAAEAVVQSDQLKTIGKINEIKESMIAKYDSMIESATDETVYQSMIDAKIQFSRSVPPENAALKNIVQKATTFPIPAMVLSYDLYGAIEKDVEITALNSVRHPGAVPPGTLDIIV